ncbi:MAG: hypothetical protein ABIE22_05335 [archaeon]
MITEFNNPQVIEGVVIVSKLDKEKRVLRVNPDVIPEGLLEEVLSGGISEIGFVTSETNQYIFTGVEAIGYLPPEERVYGKD